ncbi:hypothetical protein ACLB2K_073996 [Fragaria x ananassa]
MEFYRIATPFIAHIRCVAFAPYCGGDCSAHKVLTTSLLHSIDATSLLQSIHAASLLQSIDAAASLLTPSSPQHPSLRAASLLQYIAAAASVLHRRCFTPSPPLHRAKFFFFRMARMQLVTSPESEETSPSTSVNTSMNLRSYIQREKLKVPQKRERQEEEVEQYFIKKRALEVAEIEKDDKDEEEDEDEDLEKIPHTQHKYTLVTFFKLIESYRDKIPSEAWQLINQTCFGEMINAFRTRSIVADQVSRFELDIEILLRHYCKETKKFIFGEKEMEIKEEDVHLLFGLTKEGENEEDKISRRKKSSQQSTIFGKTKGSIFRKMIHDKLTEELNKIKNKEAKPRKIASLIIMFLLATFFFNTFGSQIEWQMVPLSSQQEVEENKRVGDNFKTLLTYLEEEIPEDLNEKLKELGKANEELQNRINDYVHKLQLADDKIKQLEMEKRAQDSLNKALKRKLKKAKSSANGPPKQKRQFGGKSMAAKEMNKQKGM